MSGLVPTPDARHRAGALYVASLVAVVVRTRLDLDAAEVLIGVRMHSPITHGLGAAPSKLSYGQAACSKST